MGVGKEVDVGAPKIAWHSPTFYATITIHVLNLEY